jgi:hypothetical protein
VMPCAAMLIASLKKVWQKSRPDFQSKFGWDIGRMLHDLGHAYVNGCPYCTERFMEMGHGLADITLDICDPRQSLFYSINTRWICQTCNRKKGRVPPELWGAQLTAWERWRRHQEQLSAHRLTVV